MDDYKAMACGMTKAESDCFLLTGQVMNSFSRLPPLHQADVVDVCNAIHVIQNILMSRPFYRKYMEK